MTTPEVAGAELPPMPSAYPDRFIAGRHPLSTLREMPDSHVISINPDGVSTPLPGHIVCPTADDLRMAISSAYEAHELEPETYYIDRFVDHELQHAQAAIAVGGVAVCFSMELWSAEGDSSVPFYFRASHRASIPAATKLALASVIAHPLELSEGDLEDLEVIGYALPNLADRIVANKENTDARQLPIPMSVRTSI